MSIDVHDAFIIEFDDACSNTLCDELIHFFETNKPNHTVISVGHYIEKKTKTSVDVPFNPEIREHVILNNRYQLIIAKTKNEYTDILIKSGLDKKPHKEGLYSIASHIKGSAQTNLIVQKSEAGQYYNWHNDWAPTQDRLLTCILYLNDLKDDAGGATHFSSGRVVKPKKGKVLIFPSSISYVHRGDMVQKGNKYIVTTFSVFDNTQLYSFPFIIS